MSSGRGRADRGGYRGDVEVRFILWDCVSLSIQQEKGKLLGFVLVFLQEVRNGGFQGD